MKAVPILVLLAVVVLPATIRHASAQDIFDAARDGKLEVVRRLCDKQPDLARSKNRAGFTPLHWAAIRGHAGVAEYLVKKGADVNAADNLGLTPLHRAAYWGHLEMSRLLLKHGANARATDKEGKTPLDWAEKQARKNVADLLRNQE